eukprot:Opistho-2@10704
MRFDNEFLYVAAIMQEPQVWANQTQHDSIVYLDNDFEVFVDPDGNTHWYKEFEVNALETTFNLILSKPYLDGGAANWTGWDVPLKAAVSIDGGRVNAPNSGNRGWSVELALPLASLGYNEKVNVPPLHGDRWRINFSRVEYNVTVVGDHYEKIAGIPEDNWVWSPQRAINMHLPERWGYLQFSELAAGTDSPTPDPRWGARRALAQMYNSLKMFYVVNGYYTRDLELLHLPRWIVRGDCASVPSIVLPTLYSFVVTVVSHADGSVGHVTDDRETYFE